ncbi:MAG: YiiD C-terminal domain-containing protein [Bacteriovoracaceae bacterium]|nr:YiiD C-terminal domain-containing protein [Bacteriovoracaceae bacterium]
MKNFINYYGPYLGAGVKLKKMSDNYRHARVEMPLTVYNRNYVGTHFGGSIYSMVDPWYMLMLIQNLGPGYIVWDKAANIRFLKPGTGTIIAEFNLEQKDLDEITTHLAHFPKMDRHFKVEIKDKKTGEIIADVDKVIYIRRK